MQQILLSVQSLVIKFMLLMTVLRCHFYRASTCRQRDCYGRPKSVRPSLVHQTLVLYWN